MFYVQYLLHAWKNLSLLCNLTLHQSIFLLLLWLHSLIHGWHCFHLSRGHLLSSPETARLMFFSEHFSSQVFKIRFLKQNYSYNDQVLGTYQEDPANSGEFPAFVKENKHLYFLKVFTLVLSLILILIANLQKTVHCRIHFTTLRDGPYQTTSAVWVEIEFWSWKLGLKLDLGGKRDQCGLCSVRRKSW